MDQILGVQLAADRRQIGVAVAVVRGGEARQHLDPVDAREPAHHDLGDADRRRVVLRLPGQVRDRHHRHDRGAVRWQGRFSESGGGPGESEDADSGCGEPSRAAPRRGRPRSGSERRRSGTGRKALAHVAQLAREIEGCRVALGGVLREAALDDPEHGRGQRRVERRERFGRVLDDRSDRLGGRLAAERLAAARELVQDRAQRELVRAEVDRAAGGLLGRHVPGGAEHRADRRVGRGRLRPGGGAPSRTRRRPRPGLARRRFAAWRDRSPGSSRSRRSSASGSRA